MWKGPWVDTIWRQRPGGRLNIKMPSDQYKLELELEKDLFDTQQVQTKT